MSARPPRDREPSSTVRDHLFRLDVALVVLAAVLRSTPIRGTSTPFSRCQRGLLLLASTFLAWLRYMVLLVTPPTRSPRICAGDRQLFEDEGPV